MPVNPRLSPELRSTLGARLGIPSAAPIEPQPQAPEAPSRLFPKGREVAIQKELERSLAKIGATRVAGFQDEVKRRYGDPRTRDADHLAGPYLSRLARSLERDHGLDFRSSFRAAEAIVREALK